MKRFILALVVLCMTAGCAHVEWFGGNVEPEEGKPPMVKVVETRF